ncbi:head GIN domain-containing protein [Aurantibacter sp.]|uniref:head GIN domain-containing protein n=1 Tax=Aurantibacter sp. TaxID=2807103 RepID=UPI0035C7AE1E
MRLFKSSIIILIILFTFSNCQVQNWKKIKGNGNIATITRTVSDFNNISLSGPMDFELVKGREGKITIVGEDNLLDYIITESKDGNLIIEQKDNYSLSPSNYKTIKITIPFESINNVTLFGSGDVISQNIIEADSFTTKISGSGDISLNLVAKTTNATISGSGDITIKGKTDHLNVSISGSGDFNGKELEANNTNAKITGSGEIEVVANESLMARITGSGDINYSGNPSQIDKKVTGSGDISN